MSSGTRRLFSGRGSEIHPKSRANIRAAAAQTAAVRHAKGMGLNNPLNSHAPNAVVTPPPTRPREKRAIAFALKNGTRHPGEPSAKALLRLQALPDSECPAMAERKASVSGG